MHDCRLCEICSELVDAIWFMCDGQNDWHSILTGCPTEFIFAAQRYIDKTQPSTVKVEFTILTNMVVLELK